MGLTKKELFSKDQNSLADIAKVFAHPARIAILEYLLKSNTCINGDLVQELGLAQPTISQHLRELRDLGIIKGNIEGVSVCYCIDREKWNEIRITFNQLFQRLDQPKEDCC
ncbi:ArsR/SmtB family transcription factor [Salinimicrobium gaetbulicola]|uniref:ArsR/SmtB family transcription factor n=1 Tax=Salinimicrobium gaetbulicola TaxID=999702 RepID=A0ABW3IGL6_9FLAO